MKTYSSIIPSSMNCIGDAVTNVTRFIYEELGALEDDSLFELKVILNELIVNAMKHGNKGDQSKAVKIIVGFVEDDQLLLKIEDEGEGHHCSCFSSGMPVTDESLSICEMKEDGRGMLIVRNLCEKVDFNESGNMVIVQKKLFRCGF